MQEKKSLPVNNAKNKQASLERLQNQLYQAQLNGDTALTKKIKAIIDRIKDKK
jgi:CRISPR/Cas system-associated endoribonuclease Cas2